MAAPPGLALRSPRPSAHFPHPPTRLRHSGFAPPAGSCGRTAGSWVEDLAAHCGHSAQAWGGGTRVRGREGSSDKAGGSDTCCSPSDLTESVLPPPPNVFQAAGVAARVTQSGFGTSGISGRRICRAVSPVGAEPGGGQGEDGDPRVSPSPCSDQRPPGTVCEPALGSQNSAQGAGRGSAAGRLIPTAPALHSLEAQWPQHSPANLPVVTAGWNPVLSPSSSLLRGSKGEPPRSGGSSAWSHSCLVFGGDDSASVPIV